MGTLEASCENYDELEPEQQEALVQFNAAVQGFSDREILAALTVADIVNERNTNIVLPLTKDPGQTAKIFDAWANIKQSGVFLHVFFDQETEGVITADSRFKALDKERDTDRYANKDRIRDEMVRLRFAIFGGRLAITAAVTTEDETPQLGNTGL